MDTQTEGLLRETLNQLLRTEPKDARDGLILRWREAYPSLFQVSFVVSRNFATVFLFIYRQQKKQRFKMRTKILNEFGKK
jgi:hypothetical protein